MADYSIDTSILQAKKIENLLLADAFERLADDGRDDAYSFLRFRSRAAMCRTCGTYLKFGVLRDGASKLVDANFCRQRLCPQCSYRRSLLVYSNISRALDWVQVWRPGLKYAFLTLTVRNVRPDDLSCALTSMAVTYNRFLSNDAVKSRIVGAIRSTEVTINKSDFTYHPHYHLILALDDSYFDGKYWTTDRWSKAWKQAGGYDYSPICHIEMIHGLQDAVKETAKYAVKPGELFSDLRHGSFDNVYYLQVGLHRKRLLSYSGVFAEARKALALKDEDSDNLVDSISRDDVFQLFVTYHWGFAVSDYCIFEVSENEKTY